MQGATDFEAGGFAHADVADVRRQRSCSSACACPNAFVLGSLAVTIPLTACRGRPVDDAGRRFQRRASAARVRARIALPAAISCAARIASSARSCHGADVDRAVGRVRGRSSRGRRGQSAPSLMLGTAPGGMAEMCDHREGAAARGAAGDGIPRDAPGRAAAAHADHLSASAHVVSRTGADNEGRVRNARIIGLTAQPVRVAHPKVQSRHRCGGRSFDSGIALFISPLFPMNDIESFATLAASVGAPVLRAAPAAHRLGARDRSAHQARSHRVVRRQRRGVRPPVRRDGRRGHVASRSIRRSARTAISRARIRPTSRGSKTARSSAASARTTPAPPTTGSRPRRCARTLDGLFDGCMRGPHDVRRAVLDGPARQSDRAHRHRAVRLPLRRRQHEAHDAHGPRRVRRARHRRRVRAVRAFGRRAARRRAARRRVAVQPGPQVHRALSRVARDLVLRLRLRRQRAARQEVLRAAHRLGDGARRGLARRAHADPRRDVARGREDLRRRRVSQRVRQDQFRDADPAARRSKAGR